MKPKYWAMLPPFGVGLLTMGVVEVAAGAPLAVSLAGMVAGFAIVFLAGLHFQQAAEKVP